MSKNAELQQRRDDAVARGVGHATQRYAVRALNAESGMQTASVISISPAV